MPRVAKTITTEEDKADLAMDEAIRKRAARQAAKRELAPLDVPQVECTVLPAGHDKISMGIHVPGLGEAHYEEGETFTAGLPSAVSLYDRGFINFEGAREASEAVKKRRDAISLADKKALEKALDGE